MDITNESVKHIADLAVGNSLVKTDIPYALVPRGYELASLEKYMIDKEQIKQSVMVTSASSLIAYLVRFKDNRSVIFADTENTRFRGVLDYHLDSKSPFKNTHIVTYDCPLSEEWKAFTGSDKQGMNQVEFAEFIEQNIKSIAPISDENPTSGGELLEMVLAFQETRQSEFKSVTRLNDGTFQIAHSNEKTGAGNTKLPEKICLALSPFHNGPAYEVKARIRYRLREGKLTLWYELIEPRKVIEDAYDAILVDLQNQLPDVPVFEGRI
ncbi:DUF2303 family protein [Serratia fonticola]|uniref:DUF2303 family protein n=1 Tax=Serratia fonticola TaxID=47917 RepID=UPI00093DFA98|nr:DUF2303 family protein [Serratia fonticola]OKP27578.1 hypothetical protein BSQ40_14610 [Serratia fonticola]